MFSPHIDSIYDCCGIFSFFPLLMSCVQEIFRIGLSVTRGVQIGERTVIYA